MEILKSKKAMWEKFYRTMEKQEERSGCAVTLTLNPCMMETLVVDGLKAGQENELYTMTADIGGLGIEISRILSGCGYASLCTGFEFSTDKKTQEQFMQMLKLPFHFAEAEGKMRSVVNILNKNGDPSTIMKERGWKISQTALKNLEKKRKKVISGLKPDDLLVIGGSVPTGVPEDIYRSWISEAKQKGTRTVLCSEGSILKEGLRETPYAVVLSMPSLAEYMGCSLETEEKVDISVKKLLQKGISMVCVYTEQYEILVADEKNIIRGKAYEKNPVCNCGALASIIAGMCMAMICKKEEDIMDYILAVLKGTLHKPGNGMCTQKEFEKYFNSVS